MESIFEFGYRDFDHYTSVLEDCIEEVNVTYKASNNSYSGDMLFSTQYLTLMILDKAIRVIRKDLSKGVKEDTIIDDVAQCISKFFAKNYNSEGKKLSKSTVSKVKSNLTTITPDNAKSLEVEYNKKHKILKRNKANEYNKSDLYYIKKAMKQVQLEVDEASYNMDDDRESVYEAAAANAYKSYPQTYVYTKVASSGTSAEKYLIEYIMNAERINKNSEAFSAIQSDIRTRQTSAILYRVLMMPDVVLCMYDKELPASYKVFRATDVRGDKKPKVFIDVTGLLKLVNGFFVCKAIDTLVSYLTAALVQLLYYNDNRQLVTNANITRMSTVCFVRLFTGVMDELRVLGYAENQTKIKYISAVYFLTSLVGKPVNQAQAMAANILSIPQREAKAIDFYYEDEDLANIDTIVTKIVESFKLKDFTTDIMIDRWIFKYGKGTMYGLELYPAFLTMLTNAYCGAYVNNQKTIEKFCGRDMVTVSTSIIRLGADVYNDGAHYEATEEGIKFNKK